MSGWFDRQVYGCSWHISQFLFVGRNIVLQVLKGCTLVLRSDCFSLCSLAVFLRFCHMVRLSDGMLQQPPYSYVQCEFMSEYFSVSVLFSKRH